MFCNADCSFIDEASAIFETVKCKWKKNVGFQEHVHHGIQEVVTVITIILYYYQSPRWPIGLAVLTSNHRKSPLCEFVSISDNA